MLQRRKGQKSMLSRSVSLNDVEYLSGNPNSLKPQKNSIDSDGSGSGSASGHLP